jgi:hypothetical protein
MCHKRCYHQLSGKSSCPEIIHLKLFAHPSLRLHYTCTDLLYSLRFNNSGRSRASVELEKMSHFVFPTPFWTIMPLCMFRLPRRSKHDHLAHLESRIPTLIKALSALSGRHRRSQPVLNLVGSLLVSLTRPLAAPIFVLATNPE